MMGSCRGRDLIATWWAGWISADGWEMTEVWSMERPGWLHTCTWKSLLETEMETLRLTGFQHTVYEIGITVRLSWNHVSPFRTNRGNWCLPRSVLGTSEWGVCVQPAPRGQADDLHGVLLFVWRGLGYAMCPLPHEGLRWALTRFLLLQSISPPLEPDSPFTSISSSSLPIPYLDQRCCVVCVLQSRPCCEFLKPSFYFT